MARDCYHYGLDDVKRLQEKQEMQRSLMMLIVLRSRVGIGRMIRIVGRMRCREQVQPRAKRPITGTSSEGISSETSTERVLARLLTSWRWGQERLIPMRWTLRWTQWSKLRVIARGGIPDIGGRGGRPSIANASARSSRVRGHVPLVRRVTLAVLNDDIIVGPKSGGTENLVRLDGRSGSIGSRCHVVLVVRWASDRLGRGFGWADGCWTWSEVVSLRRRHKRGHMRRHMRGPVRKSVR